MSQPPPSTHGPPAAGLGHVGVLARHLPGEHPQGGHVEPAAVVEAEVDVAVGPVRAAGAAAAESDGHHAGHGDEPVGDGMQIRVSHGTSLGCPGVCRRGGPLSWYFPDVRMVEPSRMWEVTYMLVVYTDGVAG
ncbi:hypothetical protein GCM10020220_006140 [Nonomuraea rubra]